MIEKFRSVRLLKARANTYKKHFKSMYKNVKKSTQNSCSGVKKTLKSIKIEDSKIWWGKGQ